MIENDMTVGGKQENEQRKGKRLKECFSWGKKKTCQEWKAVQNNRGLAVLVMNKTAQSSKNAKTQQQ